MRRWQVLVVLLLCASAARDGGAASAGGRRPRRQVAPPRLVWHVENLQGELVDSHDGNEVINPASVVKVATTLWAVERLGPEHRFETRFFARGTVFPGHGLLAGDLVVNGSGDPDFQAENAFLVALALNQLGIREVKGPLVVSRKFWMGWENGSEGTNPDPVQRGLLMAGRLRQALDSARWNGVLRRAWRSLAAARGLPLGRPPRVVVRGGIGVDGEASTGELLLVHRSAPIATALRRFNCFSNNDIERIGAAIGPPSELANLVAVRCGVPAESVQLETTSGLGINRLTPSTIVRLLRELRETCFRAGIGVESLLPVSGCDPGTVTRFFPLLTNGSYQASVVGKTGTLTTTDGGVAVVAGFASTTQGVLVFCVAAPNAGGKLHLARQLEEGWLLDLINGHGGAVPHECPAPLPGPETGADIIVVKVN